MPRINGTNSDDDIDVTGDSGTLNGVPQVSPIDNVRGRGGDDEINVSNSTIAENVDGNAGSDFVTVSGSNVAWRVASGTFTLPSGIVVTYSAFETGSGVPCFT